MPTSSRRIGRAEATVDRATDPALPLVMRFIRVEEMAGWPLLAAAAIAVTWVSSPWGGHWDGLWAAELEVQVADLHLGLSLRHVVNDLLLPLFFFVIGMEIKREVVRGELAGLRRAALPIAAAAGGVVAPAVVYLLLAGGGPHARGWGVPVATDVAFALAVLALLGDRVPAALKVLVLAFAAADDVGGVLIIAAVYSAGISWWAIATAAAMVALVVAMARFGVRLAPVYLLLGLAAVVASVPSGIHPTVTAVVLGLLVDAQPLIDRRSFVPVASDVVEELRSELETLQSSTDREERRATAEACDGLLGRLEALTVGTEAPIDRLVTALNPWVSYVVLPLFALANAGVALPSSPAAVVAHPVTVAVMLGLVVGKPLGILAVSFATVRLGLAELPRGVGWPHVAGMGVLAGIGFTISLFIARLAFSDADAVRAATLGVLAASVTSGLLGFAVLRLAPRARSG